MKKTLGGSVLFSLFITLTFAQSKIVTTGDNQINTSDPYGADIVIGSAAGTRHDSSIMWWSDGSASRISGTNDVFYFSVWNTNVPNVGIAAGVGGTSYFRGNLGLGTTGANERLVVNGNLKVMLGEAVHPEKNVVKLINLGYSGITGAQNWALRGVYQYGMGVGNNADGGDLDIIKALNGNTILGTKTDGSSLGYVGIGTVSPREMLSVNGKIRAQEIKVETSNWPDYVFRPDYALKDLTHVEEYIREHGHLPEVPSAAVTSQEGIALGEMNKILLKKIEELTLYLIEQGKEIKSLKAKINKR